LTILGVNAITSAPRQVHKIVKGGNHAGQRLQKSALGVGAIFCIVRIATFNQVQVRGRSMLKVASLEIPAPKLSSSPFPLFSFSPLSLFSFSAG
jgi:hypothetical protein